MQKIKWALLMIQTILLNNFILVATLFVLSRTIKTWHEIKHKHPHVEKQVVVYDNVHHQHYDNAEHSDYEEGGHGHNHGWGWWGRSFQTQTETTTATNEQDYENKYYTNRLARSTSGSKSLKRWTTSSNYLLLLRSNFEIYRLFI